MAFTLKNINVQELIRNANIKYPKEKNFMGLFTQIKEVFMSNNVIYLRKFYRVFAISLYFVLEFFYEVFYFYFSPFLVLVLVIMFGSDPKDQDRVSQFQKHD